MRVLIINTSETNGGAAVAANRLMEALQRNGVKAKMLVAEKQTGNVAVSQMLIIGYTNGIFCANDFLSSAICISPRTISSK